ncbi:MAG: HIT domain-containing protein [Candidatus Kapabacteria bacterium]|nr:HIT domain-containing protein [Candidatus Kapabacteria bacterium]
MERTIFERIIAREIPSTIEFEDDEIIAIRDIAPSAPLHLLIIPKRVITSVDALTEEDASLVGRVFLVARDLARKHGVAENGYRVVTNCNDHGGQTVFHLHFHLLAGEPLGRMNTKPSPPAANTSSMVFDGGLLVIVAIALAAIFNSMNPKQIPWVKKEYERTKATAEDISKYIGTSELQTQPATAPLPSSTEKPPPAATPAPASTAATAGSAATTSVPSAEKGKPAFVPEPGMIREIGYDAFVRLMNAGPFYLIDARGAEKYAEGHIAGAVNIYGGEVQSRIPDLMQSPRDRIILIYCDGGECELSHHVADVLKQFSYGPIFIYTGGWAEWKTKH